MKLLIIAGVLACCSCAAADALVGIRHDTTPNLLLEIDRSTGAVQEVAPLAPGPITGLAFDSTRQTLLGVHPFENRLYSIDPMTGVTVPIGGVGTLGFPNSNALAYDPVSDRLYSADINGDRLFSINPVTGVGTLIAPLSGGFEDIEGMAFDPATQTLFGLSDAQDRVVRIDINTGVATAIGTIGLFGANWRGLEFDQTSGLLYASTTLGSPALYTISTSTGVPTLVGFLPTDARVQGLAIVPAPSGVALVGAGIVALLRRRR